MAATIREFFETESASAVVLISAALLGLILANSPLHGAYDSSLHTYLSASIGKAAVKLDLHDHPVAGN